MDKNVYLIGNAHIDPVWLWRKTEGQSEILSTFRSALDRMDEFPEYVFTSACAYYYAWVEEVDPSLFEEIRRRVEEGRWVIVGGMWIQPDCNIPSGESMARQLLYSQRYFKEKFGRIATTGYNVDSFGHSGMLPQLLRKAGMDSYVFMRPDGGKENPPNAPIPGDLFTWKTPDGSEVLAARINVSYNDSLHGLVEAELEKGLHPAAAKALSLKQRAEGQGHPYYSFYGVGNHGGGPTIEGLKALTPLVKEHEDIVFSSPPALFEDVRQRGLAEKLPTHTLDLQHHASGCYSANAATKAGNRKAEEALEAAEKWDVLSARLTGGKEAHARLRAAWEKLMFNQFHDIAAGCCIRSAMNDALLAMAGAQDEAAEVGALATQRITWRVKTTRVLDGTPAQKNGWLLWEKEGEGAPVVLFNPHSFPLRRPVPLGVEVAGVVDAEGRPAACQQVRGEQTNNDDVYGTLLMAELPALGYATYYLYKNEEKPAVTEPLKAGDDFLENEHLRITFDKKTGLITGFVDKAGGRELCGAPMGGAVVIDDTENDTWAHGNFVFDKEVGRFGHAKTRLLEKGPLRATLRVETQYAGHSSLVQDFSLSADAKVLEVRCRLDFSEVHRFVKLSFPVGAAAPKAIYSMPYGFLEKVADGMEEPAQRWAGVYDTADGRGLALLNDGKYSFSAQGGDLRMVAARTAIYADHYGQHRRDDQVEYLDLGVQHFTYSLMPFDRGDVAPVVKEAAVLNQPPHFVLETHHDGALEPVYSGITVSEENVLCPVLKPAEDGKGHVARLFEAAGKETTCTVEIPALGAKATLSFAPQEIKTLRIEEGACREVGLVEWEL